MGKQTANRGKLIRKKLSRNANHMRVDLDAKPLMRLRYRPILLTIPMQPAIIRETKLKLKTYATCDPLFPNTTMTCETTTHGTGTHTP